MVLLQMFSFGANVGDDALGDGAYAVWTLLRHSWQSKQRKMRASKRAIWSSAERRFTWLAKQRKMGGYKVLELLLGQPAAVRPAL